MLALLPLTPMSTTFTPRALALLALGLACLFLAPPPASAGTPRPQCAATKRVVNKGKPMPWATSMFGVLKKKKYVDTKLIPSILRSACVEGPNGEEGLPGTLDFHRGWKVRDPLDLEHGSWYRLVPGKTGILLAISGWLMFEVRRCELEYDGISLGYTTAGIPFDRKVTFYGVATDEVTSVQATGGVGTRTGPDGVILPREVSITPKNNVFHLIAENGAAQLIVSRRNGAPPTTIDVVGRHPTPKCIEGP